MLSIADSNVFHSFAVYTLVAGSLTNAEELAQLVLKPFPSDSQGSPHMFKYSPFMPDGSHS